MLPVCLDMSHPTLESRFHDNLQSCVDLDYDVDSSSMSEAQSKMEDLHRKLDYHDYRTTEAAPVSSGVFKV